MVKFPDYLDAYMCSAYRLVSIRAVVYLNGELVDGCVAACVSEGYIVRFATDMKNNAYLIGDEVAVEKVYGHVLIEVI